MRVRELATATSAILIALSGFVSGCSKYQVSSLYEDPRYIEAVDHMNHHRFNASTDLFISMVPEYQQTQWWEPLQHVMMQSKAGVAGFTLFGLYSHYEHIEGIDIDSLHPDINNSFRQSVYRIRDLLSTLPGDLLNQHQWGRLTQAMQLYDELGYQAQATSNENNFKWGLLYTYSFLNRMSVLSNRLIDMMQDQNINSQTIENLLSDHCHSTLHDGFYTYKLFRHSFDRIQVIPNRIEDLIRVMISEPDLEIQFDPSSESVDQFIFRLFLDNPILTSRLLSKLILKLDVFDLASSMFEMFEDYSEPDPEIEEKALIVRAFLLALVNDLNRFEVGEIETIIGIFAAPLLLEFESLLQSCAVQESFFNRLRDLKLDHASQIYLLTQVINYLLGETYDAVALAPYLPELETLAQRVADIRAELENE